MSLYSTFSVAFFTQAKHTIFIDCIGITAISTPYIIMPFSKLATAKLAVNLNRVCLKVPADR